jgi:hypothetical protein
LDPLLTPFWPYGQTALGDPLDSSGYWVVTSYTPKRGVLDPQNDPFLDPLFDPLWTDPQKDPHLDADLRSLGTPYWPYGQKGVKKGVQKGVKNTPFWTPFWTPFLGQIWDSIRGLWSLIVVKDPQKGPLFDPLFDPFLDPFLTPFGGPPIPPKGPILPPIPLRDRPSYWP